MSVAYLVGFSSGNKENTEIVPTPMFFLSGVNVTVKLSLKASEGVSVVTELHCRNFRYRSVTKPSELVSDFLPCLEHVTNAHTVSTEPEFTWD